MKMFKSMLLLGVILAVFASGCNLSSGQRVAMLQNAITQAESISNELGTRLDEMETVLTETQAAMSDPNLPPDVREQLDKVLTQTIEGIKVVSVQRGKYAQLISRLREQLAEAETEGMGFGEELKLYGEGLKEAGKYIPPPVGGFVSLAGVIFGAVGTVLAKKRGKALTGVVHSVDKLLDSTDVNAATAKKVLKDNQSPATREAVRKINGG